MKTSYKVSLLAAAAICIFAVAYFVFQHGSSSGTKLADAQGGKTETTAHQTSQPRPTLSNSDTSQVSSTALDTGATSSGDNNNAGDASGNSLLAQLHQMQSNAEKQAARTPDQTHSGSQLTSAGNGSSATPPTDGQTPTGSELPANPPANPSDATNSVTPGQGLATSTPPADNASFGDQNPTAAPPPQPTASTPQAAPPTPIADNATPPGMTATGAGETYTIQPGDSFYSIARSHYGNASAFIDIAKANPTVDPKKLHVGQKINLPPRSAVEAAHASKKTSGSSPSAATPYGRKTYTVQVGDTLSYIARDFYKDPAKWKKIYDANRAKIGPDPAKLHPGDTLVIPPKK